jgi:hypothetical protein
MSFRNHFHVNKVKCHFNTTFILTPHPQDISLCSISSRYHQVVVNISPHQADMLVIEERECFASLSRVIVYEEIRSSIDKHSPYTVFVLFFILSYTISFLRVQFGDIWSSETWLHTEKPGRRERIYFILTINSSCELIPGVPKVLRHFFLSKISDQRRSIWSQLSF